jgi:hypothetical protein
MKNNLQSLNRLQSRFTLFLDTPARTAEPGRADYTEFTEPIRIRRKKIRSIRGIRVQEQALSRTFKKAPKV